MQQQNVTVALLKILLQYTSAQTGFNFAALYPC